MSEREKKVMIVDGGGRGSVVAEGYAKSEYVERIFAVPGNDLMYINTFGKPVQTFPRLRTTDVAEIVAACDRYNIDLVDVLQDNAIEAGLVNALQHSRIPVVGPTREAGKVEWDKSWARNLGKRAGIPQPAYEIFTSFDKGIEYIRERPDSPYFIKASGLDGGKGALGAMNSEEAVENINKLKTHGKASETFLIEEWLMGDRESNYEQGEEFSCFLFSDGRDYKVIGYAQDHKRARTFDEGDNTGGMGCINKPLVITPQIEKLVEKTILRPFFNQLKAENLSYTGVLYLGGMLVRREGDLTPYVLEWNSRWGDPEAQIIVPGIQNDFFEMGMTIVDKGVKEFTLRVDNKHRLVITGAARGYPYDYSHTIGKQIFGIREAQKTPGVKIYTSAIKEKSGKHYVDGGRIFYVAGEDNYLQEAILQAHKAISLINVEGNNLHYRTDIGHKDRERQSILSQEKCQRTYASAGVVYEPVDNMKRLAQEVAKSTSTVLSSFGFSEISESRGESAYVIDLGPFLLASTPEGLGTKDLINGFMIDEKGKESSYFNSSWDTVAMIVNDLITVGAEPTIVFPHIAAGDSKWFEDKKKVEGLIKGWAAACLASGAVYGAGETAILKDIIYPNTVEFSGGGIGIINPKSRFTNGSSLRQGDHVVFIESSGVHANGISLVRNIAQEVMPYGYHTKLPSGKTFGEALLARTHIYARVLLNVLEIASNLTKNLKLTIEDIEEGLQRKQLTFDRQGEEFYNVISAFIKSMRAGDVNAALYYLARMVAAGQDPLYIARRMVIFASEDIGMAQPTALVVANEVFRSCEVIGYPECQENLAHGVVYLSLAKKDRSAYDAYMSALQDVYKLGNLPVPMNIRNAPTKLMKDLGYGKGYNKYTKESLLPEKLKNKKYY